MTMVSRLLLGCLLGLLASACSTTTYGDPLRDVSIAVLVGDQALAPGVGGEDDVVVPRADGTYHVAPGASMEASEVLGWVVHRKQWSEIDGRERLAKLGRLRRTGEEQAAEDELLDLELTLDEAGVHRFAAFETEASIRRQVHYLVVILDGVVRSKRFDAFTQSAISLDF